MNTTKTVIAAILTALLMPLSGCSAIVAVGDAAITVGATVVKVTAKAAGAVASAVIPGGDKKKEDK